MKSGHIRYPSCGGTQKKQQPKTDLYIFVESDMLIIRHRLLRFKHFKLPSFVSHRILIPDCCLFLSPVVYYNWPFVPLEIIAHTAPLCSPPSENTQTTRSRVNNNTNERFQKKRKKVTYLCREFIIDDSNQFLHPQHGEDHSGCMLTPGLV